MPEALVVLKKQTSGRYEAVLNLSSEELKDISKGIKGMGFLAKAAIPPKFMSKLTEIAATIDKEFKR